MRSALALIAALVAASAAQAQTGGLRPATSDDIASAVSGCWSAVGPSGVDRARLEAAGWKAATATDGKGKAVPLPLGIYGKSGANSIIMLNDDGKGGQSMCVVTARLSALGDFSKTADTTQKTLLAVAPALKAGKTGDGYAFLALPRLAILNATGTQNQPGMRVIVGYQVPEKK